MVFNDNNALYADSFVRFTDSRSYRRLNHTAYHQSENTYKIQNNKFSFLTGNNNFLSDNDDMLSVYGKRRFSISKTSLRVNTYVN
jgi:hypothetical protein